jgi:hypothetical protein
MMRFMRALVLTAVLAVLIALPFALSGVSAINIPAQTSNILSGDGSADAGVSAGDRNARAGHSTVPADPSAGGAGRGSPSRHVHADVTAGPRGADHDGTAAITTATATAI